MREDASKYLYLVVFGVADLDLTVLGACIDERVGGRT